MQWIVVRLMLEVSFVGPLLEAFSSCSCLRDLLTKFESFDEIKKRGVIVGMVFVAAAFVECIKLILVGVSGAAHLIADFWHRRAKQKKKAHRSII